MNPIHLVRYAFLSAGVILSGCAGTGSHSRGKSADAPPAASTGTDSTGNSQDPQPSVTDVTDSEPSASAPTDDGSNRMIPIDQLPKKKGYPYAIKTKWPGIVKSPYAQDKQHVDVSKMSSGSAARCPHTGKIFIVP